MLIIHPVLLLDLIIFYNCPHWSDSFLGLFCPILLWKLRHSSSDPDLSQALSFDWQPISGPLIGWILECVSQPNYKRVPPLWMSIETLGGNKTAGKLRSFWFSGRKLVLTSKDQCSLQYSASETTSVADKPAHAVLENIIWYNPESYAHINKMSRHATMQIHTLLGIESIFLLSYAYIQIARGPD